MEEQKQVVDQRMNSQLKRYLHDLYFTQNAELNDSQIGIECFNFDRMWQSGEMVSEEMGIFLTYIRMLKPTTDCDKCPNKMTIMQKGRINDGIFYKCTFCDAQKSIRQLTRIKVPGILTFKMFLFMIFIGFAEGISMKLIRKMVYHQFHKFCGIGSVRTCYRHTRTIVAASMVARQKVRKLAGEVYVQEIFVQRGNLKGSNDNVQYANEIWIFGLQERGSTDVLFYLLPDKEASTYEQILAQSCSALATTVYHDQLVKYKHIRWDQLHLAYRKPQVGDHACEGILAVEIALKEVKK